SLLRPEFGRLSGAVDDQAIALRQIQCRTALRASEPGTSEPTRQRIADGLRKEPAELLDNMRAAAKADLLLIESRRRRLAQRLAVEADDRRPGEAAEQRALEQPLHVEDDVVA